MRSVVVAYELLGLRAALPSANSRLGTQLRDMDSPDAEHRQHNRN